MGVQSRWEKYPTTYREKEMKILAGWITAGESGAVVGLPGTGRSTLLNILCRRPEILHEYLDKQSKEVVLIPVDLNNLPVVDLSTLYRVILRSFFEIRDRFDISINDAVAELYHKYEAAQDPFLPQSGLRELLLKFEREEKTVVLVMNRFDSFCQDATPEMTRTLRGLRDRFKNTLCYIMGMDQEVSYFSNLESVKPLYNILDTHVLWVGPLNKEDTIGMINRELKVDLDQVPYDSLYSLTGGYPSLVRVVCHWWSETGKNQPNKSKTDIKQNLLKKRNVQNRLLALFNAITQEEQVLLRDIAEGEEKKNLLLNNPTDYQKNVLTTLTKKGICQKHSERKWMIFSQLMETYPRLAPGKSLGLIWWKEATSEIFQGTTPLTDLTPLERKVLIMFLQNARYLFTYTELAEGAWIGEEDFAQGVSNEAIQQVISGLRKKIEPDRKNPRYIISWRGQPEGGYQFFPEGRPN